MFCIFLGNGLNMVGWAFIVQIRYYLLIAACCMVAGAYCFMKLRNQPITFKYYSLFICLWPIIPIITSMLSDGDIGLEMRAIPTWVFASTMFLVYHYFRYTERRVLWILLTVAVITVTIQILQQVNPLFAIFGGSPDDLADVVTTDARNGIARYFVGSYQVQMFAMCFVWYKMLKEFSLKWILMSMLMLVSIYLYLTKQILISTMFTLALSFIMVKGRNVKIVATVLAVLSISLLVVFWDALFGEMIRDSQDSSFSYAIRFEFIGFLSEYNLTDPIGVLLGHGYSYPLLADWQHRLYYPSDVGFFGESIYFGWAWALAYFYVAFRILVTYRNRVPAYIRLYVVCSGLISVFIFPYRNRIELFNWVSVLYIASLYIDNYNAEKEQSEHIKETITDDNITLPS